MFATLRSLWQSLSLSKQFAIVALAVLVPGMAVTGLWIAQKIGDAVVRNTAGAIAISMDGLLEPYAVELSSGLPVSPTTQKELDGLLERARNHRTIVSMKIWRLNGTVLYSTFPSLIGKRFAPTPLFEMAKTGKVAADFDSDPHVEDANERLENVPLLEVYAPLRHPVTRKIVAIAEFYANGEQLGRDVTSAVAESWIFVCVVAGMMIALLSVIALKGGRTIAQQQEQLQHQVSELKSLLQVNEGLRDNLRAANETVSSVNEEVLQHVGADLHDGPAQRISYAVMRLSDLRRRTKGVSGAKSAIDDLRDILSETLVDIRRMSGGLALPELQDCTLIEAVELAVKSHEEYTGTEVRRRFRVGMLAGSLALRNCAYRLVQESLTNAYKHGKAEEQSVEVRKLGGEIMLRIADQGPGIPKTLAGRVKGLGLRGMRARVDALGGTLSVESATAGGTVVTAVLPATEGHNGNGK